MLRRSLILTLVLLGGAAFAAGPASADDYENCETADDSTDVCIVDKQSGDPGDEESACQDYEAFTGVTAEHESDAGDADARAGGYEECDAFFGNEFQDEGIVAELDADQDDAGSVDAEAGWERSSSFGGPSNATGAEVFVTNELGNAGAEVEWGEGFGGPDVDYAVFANAAGANHFTFGDVPTGEVAPPAPPNPGWGDVLPHALTESLPE